MRTIVYEGIVTAQSSIMHNGFERSGNISLFRREARLQPNGKVENVPIISGNAIRGILRDKGMLYMLSRLGYGTNHETGEIRGLPLNAFYFLLSGGSLTSTGDSGINLDYFRKVRNLLPLVSVFGGALGNAIMPGRLKVGKMVPICKQTIHLMPDFIRENNHTPPSFYDLIQNENYTRRDDAKNDLLTHLLADKRKTLQEEDQEYLQTTLFVDNAPETKPIKEEKANVPQQMIYETETLIAGTQMHWSLELQDPTDLEYEAFVSALLTFASSPYVGGRSAIGHGRIGVKFEKFIDIDPRVNLTGTEVDFKLGDRYHNHLTNNIEEINGFLKGLK